MAEMNYYFLVTGCKFSYLNCATSLNLILHYSYSFFGLLKEFFVKSADRVELMAMLGIFGAIISAFQMYPTFLVF